MAHQCARVVEKVDAAKENGGYLDLSNCQLTQVPDAIFLLMKNVNLHSCNLSNNVITKIPPKLPTNFSLIKVLDLSNNRVSGLPNEMRNLTLLETLDISWNSFDSLPPVIAEMPNIRVINAKRNLIVEVELETFTGSVHLESLNLENNPLNEDNYEKLTQVTSVKIFLSEPGQTEDKHVSRSLDSKYDSKSRSPSKSKTEEEIKQVEIETNINLANPPPPPPPPPPRD